MLESASMLGARRMVHGVEVDSYETVCLVKRGDCARFRVTTPLSPAPNTGALRKDLIAAVGTLRRAFVGPLRQALPGLVADMANDPELALAVRRQVLAPRRKSMRAALERARARGEARATLDIELLLDLLAGPFYFRTLFGHRRIDRRMTRDVVDYVLKIVARRSRQANSAAAA